MHGRRSCTGTRSQKEEDAGTQVVPRDSRRRRRISSRVRSGGSLGQDLQASSSFSFSDLGVNAILDSLAHPLKARVASHAHHAWSQDVLFMA